MKITQGPDMPEDEFRALLDRQPATAGVGSTQKMVDPYDRPAKLEATWLARQDEVVTDGVVRKFSGQPITGRDWPTPDWHELSEAQHAQMYEVERARRRRAEEQLDEVRGLIVSGSPFQRRTYLRGVSGEQARWTQELRRILGMGGP